MAATVETRDGSADAMPRAGTTPPPPEPLRVLTFLNSYAPGGVERVAMRLHAAWTMAGVETRLVLADGSIAPIPHPLENVVVLGRNRTAGGRFLALLRALPGHVAQHSPHILFCAGNTYAALAVCLKLRLGARCPTIVAKISNDLVRDDMAPLTRWWYRRWLQLQGRYIDQFVGMAPAMRGEIATLIGVAADRISIIENPALADDDIARLADARARATRARPGRQFLAVGRLVPQKNFTLLLDAFARIARPDDRLAILGEGPERRALAAQAARLGLSARLALPGHVEPLDAWLAEADAFVLSSAYEGVPAVLIEALATGLPIVATDCCVSMADLLGHGRLGQIVPAGDAAALAAAMDGVTAMPSTAAAQRVAAGRFTIEHATGRYVAMMRSVSIAATA